MKRHTVDAVYLHIGGTMRKCEVIQHVKIYSIAVMMKAFPGTAEICEVRQHVKIYSVKIYSIYCT